ncbi:MAG TPA: hypothetical protein VN922_07845, partial [Bacteroidia bacterium]|nr:hypothetical protein [Bacteroidia bacterium]
GTLHATFENHVYVSYVEGNYSYLLLLFVCFIPAGAVLFLLKKLHSFDNKKLDWGHRDGFSRSHFKH